MKTLGIFKLHETSYKIYEKDKIACYGTTKHISFTFSKTSYKIYVVWIPEITVLYYIYFILFIHVQIILMSLKFENWVSFLFFEKQKTVGPHKVCILDPRKLHLKILKKAGQTCKDFLFHSLIHLPLKMI